VPTWVKPVTPAGDIEAGSEPTGIVYLLSDQQENLERSALYYHEVRKITSETGIKIGASISVSFNPAFERLVFHSVKLTRRGVASNRFDRSRIKLAQKEEDPERLAYDSSWLARMTLDDVRVGDVIEFAFSTEGTNPLRRGKYSKIYLAQVGTFMSLNVFRIIYPANRTLVFRAENGAREPTVTTANGITELWYEDRNVPGRTIEDDVPDGYEPRQLLAVTEFRNWAEIADWAASLFHTESAHSAPFDAEIKKLRIIVDTEQRVMAALQFVEDEIRYIKLGERIGARALTAPDEVLRRGFADKMDKALLLLALLRGTDIDAAPAVVSWSNRGMIRKMLPSVDLFDDAIVQVRLGERTYWLDTSATAQRGPLSQMYVPRFDCALVLRPGSAELTPVEPPVGSLPVRKIVENYRIPTPDKTAELEVISEYRGLAADRTRSLFRENSREEIQKQYLEFYNRRFPDAKALKPPWYEEIPGENACRVTESYVIPGIWDLNEEKDRYTLSLRPGEIYSALGSTISPQRADPLKLEYPNTVIEELNVQMFENWGLDSESQTIDTEYFHLTDKPSADGSNLQFHYVYQARKDRVEPGEFTKFNEMVTSTRDKLGYTLRYRTPEQLMKIKGRGTFNWPVGVAALCWFGTLSFFGYRYFYNNRLAQSVPPPVDAAARLNGIGGWLILLAIGHALLPLRFVKTGFALFSTTMNTSAWRALTDPIEPSYHAWWAPTLLFELFFNIAMFLFAALLVALFFTKRAAWPRAYVLFLIINLMGAILDTILVDRIPSAAESVLTSLLGIVPIALGAIIWIPYVLFSKRVKATFRY
jgi:hypothetical protein